MKRRRIPPSALSHAAATPATAAVFPASRRLGFRVHLLRCRRGAASRTYRSVFGPRSSPPRPAKNLSIFVTCVHNMPLYGNFTSTHGKTEGKHINFDGWNQGWKRQGEQQIEGYLTSNMVIFIHAVAACLPRTFPSLVSPV